MKAQEGAHSCETSAQGVLDEDGNRWCIAHGGGYRCAEPGCETSARSVLDEDGNRWCHAHGGGYRCAEPGFKPGWAQSGQWITPAAGAVGRGSTCGAKGEWA